MATILLARRLDLLKNMDEVEKAFIDWHIVNPMGSIDDYLDGLETGEINFANSVNVLQAFADCEEQDELREAAEARGRVVPHTGQEGEGLLRLSGRHGRVGLCHEQAEGVRHDDPLR